eukprot:jgi/Botrbrau1/22242/Bobra.0138s0004.1
MTFPVEQAHEMGDWQSEMAPSQEVFVVDPTRPHSTVFDDKVHRSGIKSCIKHSYRIF